MAQVGEVFVNFGANTQGLLTGTARAGNILRRFSETGAGAAVVLGASFVTVSRAVANFASEAINGFKDFDFEITRAKALSGATNAEFKKLTFTAQELGRVTEYTATEAAEGMANLALAGFNANEIISAVPHSLRLATAGGVGLGKTNTILANSIRGFRLEADQANQVANVLTATFTTTNTTLESLAQTFKNATGPLSILGVKMEEIAAAAGVLGDVGISASVAGTGLKNFGIKLAKSFGVDMDKAGESAKEFFETLGVTKDRLFDATTGTFDMVEATIAFKEAMDKLGTARAPEFLGQLSTLFGERNAVSLAALVKEAEKLKVSSQNIRITEMIGDVQAVFEDLSKIGTNTLYMTNSQEGLNEEVKKMAGLLDNADSIMEEFMENGEGANGAIRRMVKNFEDVEKIMQRTFGENGGKVFTKTNDGLMQITAYSKNNSIEMLKYEKILEQLADKSITGNRRKELEEERNATYQLISADKRTVEELTSLGRARLLQITAQLEYIRGLKETEDGTSKAANQLKALSRLYKGNEENIVMAAQALGIQISENDKFEGTLAKVRDNLLKTNMSYDAQEYAMSRLVSQSALVNTAWDMQTTQLATLKGSMEILSSGVEAVSNKLAKALAPALDAVMKSGTEFLRTFTLSNDEMERGVTASELFSDAWFRSFQIFRSNGGIFSELQKSFEGLSSWGKSLTGVVGILGASGIAAGGAFVWVQGLLPALIALSGAFLQIVLPVTILVTLFSKLGLELSKARERLKEIGDIGGKGIHEIVMAFNDLKDAAGEVNGRITETEAGLMKVYTNLADKLKVVKGAYDSLIERLETLIGRTEQIKVLGGNFTLFKKGNIDDTESLKESVIGLAKVLSNVSSISNDTKKSLYDAVRTSNFEEANRILSQTPELLNSITKSGMRLGLFKGISREAIDFQNILKGVPIDSEETKKSLESAFKSKNIFAVSDALKKFNGLVENLNGMGATINLVDNGKVLSNVSSLKLLTNMLDNVPNKSKSVKNSLLKAFQIGDVRKVNELLQENSDIMDEISRYGAGITFMSREQAGTIFNVNNATKELDKILQGVSTVSEDTKQKLKSAFESNNISEFNSLLRENKDLQIAISSAGFSFGFIKPQISDVLSMNDSVKLLEKTLKGNKVIADDVYDSFEKAFKSRNAIAMNEILSKNSKIMETLESQGYAAGFATENQRKEMTGLTEMIREAEKAQADLRKEIASSDMNHEEALAKTKKLEEVTANLHDFENRRSKLFSKIISSKGVIGKLTDKELKDLNELEYKIKAQKEHYDTIKTQYENITKKIKEGNLSEKERNTLILEQEEVFKKLSGSHEKLSDSQRRYNKILQDSSDKNPFMLMYRYAQSLAASPQVMKFMEGFGQLVDKVFGKVIEGVNKATPYLVVMWDSFSNAANKFIEEIWPDLKAVGGAMLNLFVAVFEALSRVFIGTFDALGSESNDAFTILRDVLLKVADWINKIADWIKNLDVGQIKNMAIAFAGAWVAFKAFEGAGAILDGVALRFSKLSSRASGFGSILGDLKFKLLDIYTDPANAAWIASLEQGAQKMKMMTKNSQAFKSFSGAGQKVADIGNMLPLNKMSKINPLNLFKGGANGAGKAFSAVFEKGLGTPLKNISKITGNVGKNSGLLGKAGGLLLSPLSMATGLMGSLSSSFAVLPALIAAVATAIGPIIAAIAIIGALIAGIIYAFKNNIGGFRDTVMGFIAMVGDKIGMLSGKLWAMISKFMDMVKSVAERIAPFIAPVLNGIMKVIYTIVSFVMDGIGNIMDFLGGLFEFIDGLASGNKAKILGGLISMGEAIIQMILGIVTFVFKMGAEVFGFFYGNAAKLVGWLVDLIGTGLSKIPGLDWIAKKVKQAAEGIKEFGTNVVNSDKLVEGLGKMSTDAVANFAEDLRKRAGAKTKAESEREAIEKRAKDIADKKKAKEDKEKEEKRQADLKQQEYIDAMLKAQNETADKLKGAVENRPNVTNNTYVEYRAAEDDEVNRRMIERIMNDILKADVGAMIGDSSGVN